LLYLLGISESTITSLSEPRGDHAFARRYCWPGSNYPVTLHDCSPGPPPGAARAAEASLPVPRSPRAAFSLSGASPIPGSRRPLSRFAASDVCPFSWAYAADFGVISSVGHCPHSCFELLKKFWWTCTLSSPGKKLVTYLDRLKYRKNSSRCHKNVTKLSTEK